MSKKILTENAVTFWDELARPTALWPGEDEKAYQALYENLFRAVRPRDIVEKLLLNELVDVFWEIMRFRGFDSVLLRVHQPAALRNILAAKLGTMEASERARKWAAGDEASRMSTLKALEELAISTHDLNVLTWREASVELDRVSSQLEKLEARLKEIYRLFDSHDALRVRRLPNIKAPVEDADFRDVAPRQKETDENDEW